MCTAYTESMGFGVHSLKQLSAYVLVVSLFASTCVAQIPGSIPGQKDSDWTTIQRLKVSTRVLVEMRSGEELEGDFVGASESVLRFDAVVRGLEGGLVTPREFPRSAVTRVYKLGQPWSTAARALLGGAIGVGVGAGIGAALDSRYRSNEDKGILTATLGLLGGAIGAGVGAKIHGPSRKKLIYRAD